MNRIKTKYIRVISIILTFTFLSSILSYAVEVDVKVCLSPSSRFSYINHISSENDPEVVVGIASKIPLRILFGIIAGTLRKSTSFNSQEIINLIEENWRDYKNLKQFDNINYKDIYKKNNSIYLPINKTLEIKFSRVKEGKEDTFSEIIKIQDGYVEIELIDNDVENKSQMSEYKRLLVSLLESLSKENVIYEEALSERCNAKKPFNINLLLIGVGLISVSLIAMLYGLNMSCFQSFIALPIVGLTVDYSQRKDLNPRNNIEDFFDIFQRQKLALGSLRTNMPKRKAEYVIEEHMKKCTPVEAFIISKRLVGMLNDKTFPTKWSISEALHFIMPYLSEDEKIELRNDLLTDHGLFKKSMPNIAVREVWDTINGYNRGDDKINVLVRLLYNWKYVLAQMRITPATSIAEKEIKDFIEDCNYDEIVGIADRLTKLLDTKDWQVKWAAVKIIEFLVPYIDDAKRQELKYELSKTYNLLNKDYLSNLPAREAWKTINSGNGVIPKKRKDEGKTFVEYLDYAKKRFLEKLRKMESDLFHVDKEKRPNSLILYADDLIDKGVILDIEETLNNKKLKAKKILSNGEIILYVKNRSIEDEEVKALKTIIERSDSSIKVVIIGGTDLGKSLKDDAKEMKVLQAFAMRRLNKKTGITPKDEQILGIFRGFKRRYT